MTNDNGAPARLTPDRLAAVDATEFSPASLVGSYFHSFKERDGHQRTVWQGCVVAEPAPGYYLVETFEWIAGGSHSQQLVRIEDMTGWQFYDTAEWMNNEYENRPRPERA
jgi:hypothetical protein